MWICNQNAINQLLSVGTSTALLDHLFNNAATFSNAPGTLPLSTLTQTYTSSATALVKAPDVVGLKAILYDTEHWSQTPAAEQRDPLNNLVTLDQFARSKGLQLIFAPAIDLVYAIAPPGANDKYDAFLALNIYGKAANYVDVIEVQAQQLQGTSRYLTFLQEAVAQIRTASATVPIIAGMSSMPLGVSVEGWQLLRDYNATKDIVQGYWINTPVQSVQCPTCGGGNPLAMKQFLERVAETV